MIKDAFSLFPLGDFWSLPFSSQDLSLRAYLGGWKNVFVDHLTCLNELPSQFGAYRKQQHRWTCGPVQLWRKVWPQIWSSRLSLSFWPLIGDKGISARM